MPSCGPIYPVEELTEDYVTAAFAQLAEDPLKVMTTSDRLKNITRQPRGRCVLTRGQAHRVLAL
jgi:hypothetical protein